MMITRRAGELPIPSWLIGGARGAIAVVCCCFLIASCLSGCDRTANDTAARTTDEPPLAASALSNVYSLTNVADLQAFTAMHDATLSVESARLVIHSSGKDPEIAVPPLRLAPGAKVAIRLDFETAIQGNLEIYYQTRSSPDFSESRVVRAPVHTGRNVLLIDFRDVDLNGVLRLDPGEAPGEYAINGMEIFSSSPVTVVRQPMSQEKLAAAFNASTQIIFETRTPADFDALKVKTGATTRRSDDGLAISATDNDPEILLPEIATSEHLVVEIVLDSPVDTTLQLFYLVAGQTEYDAAHAVAQPLKKGANTVYMEVADRSRVGLLRLDPGMVAGQYVLRRISIRNVSAGGD
jgi:hypothetical protein